LGDHERFGGRHVRWLLNACARDAPMTLARDDLQDPVVRLLARYGGNVWQAIGSGAGPIPHDFKYWFESAGERSLELVQVEASTKSMTQPETDAQRIDSAPRKSSFEGAQFFDARR
jgi:hypothetical protein